MCESEDSLEPQVKPPVQHVRQSLFHEIDDLPFMVPGREVSRDDQLVVKAIRPLAVIVQVHVAMFVDLF